MTQPISPLKVHKDILLTLNSVTKSELNDLVYNMTGDELLGSVAQLLDAVRLASSEIGNRHAIDELSRLGIAANKGDLVGSEYMDNILNDVIANQLDFGDEEFLKRTVMGANVLASNSYNQAKSSVYSASGVDSKTWSAAGPMPCEECLAMDGMTIAVDDSFPDGDPPQHPNCYCNIEPTVSNNQ